jgi:hypothetical protein
LWYARQDAVGAFLRNLCANPLQLPKILVSSRPGLWPAYRFAKKIQQNGVDAEDAGIDLISDV